MRTSMSGFFLGGLVGLVATGAVGWAWTDAGNYTNKRDDSFANLQLFANVLERVQQEYVVEIDQAEAIDAALNGMLTSLDPHSSYLDAETFTDFQEQSSGQYGGLGIEVTLSNGFVKVISPMDGSPAARAGIEAGDLITGIDGQIFKSQSINDSVRVMRGEPGTTILLNILRESGERLEVPVTREVIQIESVKSRVIDGQIGYIRISTFDEKTSERLVEALKGLTSSLGKSGKGIILDLRNNGGGLLFQAVAVSSAFLDGGLVVSTRARRPEHNKAYGAQEGGYFEDTPVIVLINRGSASASEIVAGALQDRGRATIVGEASFGKGSVQNLIPLGGEQGAIRLTTAKYYTPADRSIQARGISPDLRIGQSKDSAEAQNSGGLAWTEASLPNAMDTDQIEAQDETVKKVDVPPEEYEGEDYQLDRATALLLEPNGIRNAIIAQQTD